MSIEFGREICGNLATAEAREWLVTNGKGSYASGTVAGTLTRSYHGLLVAALKPPVERTVLLTKLDETAQYNNHSYSLYTNRWAGELINPDGYVNIERFRLEGTIPVWDFVFADALLEKRIWMEPRADTTYIHYQLKRASQPLTLSIKALVNYRDYHSKTKAGSWRMRIDSITKGLGIKAFNQARTFFLLAENASIVPASGDDWYRNFVLTAERDRGLDYIDDNLFVGTFQATIPPGGTFTFVASTETNPNLNGAAALERRNQYEQKLLQLWQVANPKIHQTPDWVNQLVLAADQFIVDRPLPDNPDGKTIIAGYHWFTDWGRDTMISLPGLTLATGRKEIAGSILRTFAKYINRGMLPNVFPDSNRELTDNDYNTVDATLWFFEAIRSYYTATQDKQLLEELFPKLGEIIDAHIQGTRYQIKLDPEDGLIYAGQDGVQLTWMDAKIGNWVVTPRIGKPIEINALWYNALQTMSEFAQHLQEPSQKYDELAKATLQGFQRFWNSAKGYCFDVLDSPTGNDDSLRPNQIFAVSLPKSPLTPEQQQKVVEVCGQTLLTSYGLRSLATDNPQYEGFYGGDQYHRDKAYHQGTVWGWLIGPFVLAHFNVFQDPALARQFLEPIKHHITNAGLGTISEIFNGDLPIEPKGCIAQAWSVAEVLRAWVATDIASS
ncbi:putative glycogen debranching enzyme [Nostoc sp. NIES-4103]|nr:putative glycogen debranching enzyme [Nostoc sp. NIES-4103]